MSKKNQTARKTRKGTHQPAPLAAPEKALPEPTFTLGEVQKAFGANRAETFSSNPLAVALDAIDDMVATSYAAIDLVHSADPTKAKWAIDVLTNALYRGEAASKILTKFLRHSQLATVTS